MTRYNELGQPIGFPVPDWQPRPVPPRTDMAGAYCRVEPLDVSHAVQLHEAYSADHEQRIWTYLGYGPFADLTAYRDWLAATCLGDDPLFHAVIEHRSGTALGVASYLRIEPVPGVIEVGHINFSPRLQGTPAATEAMYLMMSRVFDELGYRRYEWKCDALNQRSRSAALRLGFRFEGIFRQATIYKGRNRDTAWYAVTDADWPVLRNCYLAWLDRGNFDDEGRQRKRLSVLVDEARSVE